ncbi:glycosyltransferase [Hoyosella sp. YIM 151337]|uniref:glycosyltransferase n=1 Tax=Hoyosella sp. YIM 151337 TaxID=2992742 RepID=UPI002236BA50|nr:glycosyltransferase [Hoyosella sp. YIM 151337]MCW4351985.1 glycosyltransferase [Hoyosella sp. YIM 151337]
MRILIWTHGTRGDVQPYLALGYALHNAGHEPVVAGPRCYSGHAEQHGLNYAGLDDRWNRLTDDPEIRHALESNYAGVKGKKLAGTVIRRTRAYMATVLREIADVADEGMYDAVVHHTLVPGQHLGEYLDVPTFPVALQPVWIPTSAFPSPLGPQSLPPAFNRMTYSSSQFLVRAMFPKIGAWRAGRLGLPRYRRRMHNPFVRPDGAATTTLQAFSNGVLPADPAYPDTVHTTGFWYLPAPGDWQPAPALAAFLSNGERPVYIGFGSMTGKDPAQTAATVSKALAITGMRAIVVTGEGGLREEAFSGDVFVAGEIPHDWLFPLTRVIVHHGGGGTTGAALRAGIPQVICPFTGDQPFWARQMHRIGVSPPPVSQADITAEGLARAITHAVTSSTIAAKAAQFAQTANSEHGVTQAVQIIEQAMT